MILVLRYDVCVFTVQMSNFWFDTISFNSSKKKEGYQIELYVEQPINCKLINSKVGKFSIPNQTNDGSNYFGSSHTAKEHLQKTIDISCFTKSSKRKFSPIPNLFPSFSTEHFKNWIGYQSLWSFVLEWWMIQVEKSCLDWPQLMISFIRIKNEWYGQIRLTRFPQINVS